MSKSICRRLNTMNGFQLKYEDLQISVSSKGVTVKHSPTGLSGFGGDSGEYLSNKESALCDLKKKLDLTQDKK